MHIPIFSSSLLLAQAEGRWIGVPVGAARDMIAAPAKLVNSFQLPNDSHP